MHHDRTTPLEHTTFGRRENGDMKTVAVKLTEQQAQALAGAAERYGLTTSAAIAALLASATDNYADFRMLGSAEPRKRGRAARIGAGAVKDLNELTSAGWTAGQLIHAAENGTDLDGLLLGVRAGRTD